jgi:hypothetical protein
VTARRVDLSAARKAREEQKADPPVVVLGKEEFTLPPTLPALTLVGLARARRGEFDGIEDVVESLFGEQSNRVLALGLEVEDIDDIITGAYGEDSGEEPASAS